MNDSTSSTSQPYSLFRNRSFVAFVVNRTFNAMGLHAFTVAIGWHVYQLTGDPLDLGLIGLAQFAPVLALFLVAGVAADRFDRRLILILCNVVLMGTVGLTLAVLTLELATMPIILAILVLHGAARGFYHPASQAILPNLLPTDQFPRAVAFSSSANKAAQLLGPASGGALIAWIGDGVYPVIILFFAISAVSGFVITKATRVITKEPVTLNSVMGGVCLRVAQQDRFGGGIH